MCTNSNPRIAAYIDAHTSGTLPASVLHEARRALLDTLGCMIAGIDTPIGTAMSRLGKRFSDNTGQLLLSGNTRCTTLHVAMAHGFMANAHDADDGHRYSRLHAGGVVIPAALVAAEEHDCSGVDLLEAIVLGFEFAHRTGIASTTYGHYFGSAYGGAFGAAAACGRIAGFRAQEIINAMGICEMHAPSSLLTGWLNARRVPMIKEGMGWAAASGLMAAYMTAEGITGTLAIFDTAATAGALSTLGSEYEIMRRYYKPGPGCRWSHIPAQALGRIIEDHQIAPEAIKAIRVRIFDKAITLDLYEPPTMEDAEYSIPFILGSILADGVFGPVQLHPERLRDKTIIDYARKVTLEEASEFNAAYPQELHCEVIVTTVDGQELRAPGGIPPGDVGNPLSDEQLVDKFVQMSVARLDEGQARAISERIWSFDSERVGEFMCDIRTALNPIF